MPTLVVPSASSLAIILMAILYPMLQGMVIFGLATCLFGILSGGGLAMFYAVIAMIPGIAETAGVHGMLITLPMQMIANLSRTIFTGCGSYHDSSIYCGNKPYENSETYGSSVYRGNYISYGIFCYFSSILK